MKRVALCFRGLHDLFFQSWDNLRDMIVQDLQDQYHVDIFLNTYKTPLSDSIESVLKPVSVLYNEPRNHWGSAIFRIIPTQLVECCQMVKEYEKKQQIHYDFIIITRFDLTFNNKFREYDIQYDKINMECMLVPDMNSGDNFFLFPREFLDIVVSSAFECMEQESNSHQMYKWFLNNGGPCHYICGGTTKRNPTYDVMFRFTRFVV